MPYITNDKMLASIQRECQRISDACQDIFDYGDTGELNRIGRHMLRMFNCYNKIYAAAKETSDNEEMQEGIPDIVTIWEYNGAAIAKLPLLPHGENWSDVKGRPSAFLAPHLFKAVEKFIGSEKYQSLYFAESIVHFMFVFPESNLPVRDNDNYDTKKIIDVLTDAFCGGDGGLECTQIYDSYIEREAKEPYTLVVVQDRNQPVIQYQEIAKIGVEK